MAVLKKNYAVNEYCHGAPFACIHKFLWPSLHDVRITIFLFDFPTQQVFRRGYTPDTIKMSITTKIRLWSIHLAPDFASPPKLASPLPMLASPSPELASPPPELELSLCTELILDSLTTDINPLHVLLSPPQCC